MLGVCKVGHGNGRGGASVAASLTPPLLLLLLLLLLAALQTSGDATADTAVLGAQRDDSKPAPPVELCRAAAAEPAGTSTAAAVAEPASACVPALAWLVKPGRCLGDAPPDSTDDLPLKLRQHVVPRINAPLAQCPPRVAPAAVDSVSCAPR